MTPMFQDCVIDPLNLELDNLIRISQGFHEKRLCHSVAYRKSRDSIIDCSLKKGFFSNFGKISGRNSAIE